MGATEAWENDIVIAVIEFDYACTTECIIGWKIYCMELNGRVLVWWRIIIIGWKIYLSSGSPPTMALEDGDVWIWEEKVENKVTWNIGKGLQNTTQSLQLSMLCYHSCYMIISDYLFSICSSKLVRWFVECNSRTLITVNYKGIN